MWRGGIAPAPPAVPTSATAPPHPEAVPTALTFFAGPGGRPHLIHEPYDAPPRAISLKPSATTSTKALSSTTSRSSGASKNPLHRTSSSLRSRTCLQILSSTRPEFDQAFPHDSIMMLYITAFAPKIADEIRLGAFDCACSLIPSHARDQQCVAVLAGNATQRPFDPRQDFPFSFVNRCMSHHLKIKQS